MPFACFYACLLSDLTYRRRYFCLEVKIIILYFSRLFPNLHKMNWAQDTTVSVLAACVFCWLA